MELSTNEKLKVKIIFIILDGIADFSQKDLNF